MAEERDDEQFGKTEQAKEFGKDKQPPTGQQGQAPEFGQQQQPSEFGQQGQQGQAGGLGSQPTMSGQDQSPSGSQDKSSSGQADFGKSGETDTLTEKPGFGQGIGASQSPGGTGGAQGGFVGSQGTGSDDYLREEGSSGGSDFAGQGQGALDQDEDIETGEPNRRDNDIEGGSGA
jgi:hypothetical protein